MELAQRKQTLNRFAFVATNTDVLMGFAAMSILMVMVIPIPAMLLDLFLSFNITLSLIILLVGMWAARKSKVVESHPHPGRNRGENLPAHGTNRRLCHSGISPPFHRCYCSPLCSASP